jgi:hypothetical protein
MPTNRRPTTSSLRTGTITPAAIHSYRRLRAQDGRCTCPPPPAWIPGQNVFVASDPVCQEREQRSRQAWAACEAERAKCPACPVIAAESEFLVEELRLPVRPWQSRFADFPGVWEALEAAAAQEAPGRRRRRSKKVDLLGIVVADGEDSHDG